MKKTWHSLKNRVTAMLLALICVLGLLPTAALAAGADTIKLERFGMSGVSYQSASLGRCTMHQMYYGVGGKTSVGFCGTKGGGMGTSLIGQTWGDPKPITDPTVKMMMAYYYAHSLGIFTDKAQALGVDDIWDSGYSWYMNAWVQAIVWRYKDGSLGDPATACAEELMYVWNSLKGASYTSIDQTCDGTTFRDRTKYILDLGKQDVWGDCAVKEYSFTGAGSAAHPASTVQNVMIGSLTVTNERYTLVVKKVDATNPTKGLAGARFHVESTNGSFSKDIVTGADGTYTFSPLDAGTYAVTETAAPNGYEIDNAGPEYVVLPNNGSSTVTITFTDTPTVTATGKIRKVDADDPTRGLAGAVIKITGVDNNFTGTYTTGAGGALTDVPWDTMPIGSYVAEEVTPPNGYSLSKDAGKVRQEFYWDGKTDVSLVFENDAKVKIQLIKLNDANSPLPGAVFHILRDGQLIGTEVTDASGRITVPNVTEGMYAFVEVSAPAPYAKLTAPVCAHVDQATVNGGGTVTVTAKDQKLPNLTIQKLDKQTKQPIPGTVFEIKGIHYGYHQDVTTGPDGKAVLTAVPVDSYEVKETSVPDPYVVGGETIQTIYLGPGDDQNLVFENLKMPQLTVTKIDAEDSKPVPGTVFTVEGIDSDFSADWTTGADGTVTDRVAPGSYKITEKSVPAPYYLPSKSADREQTVSLNAGDEVNVTFRNRKMPQLTIYKEDSVAGAPIEGAKFHITYTSSGESAEAPATIDYGNILTDAKGEIRLHEQGKRLYPGEYTVTEVEPAPGFQMKEPSTQKIILHGSESKTLTFQNTPLNAIIVEKYDSVTHEALPGCTFQLRFLSGTSGTGGTTIGQKVTGKNGTAIWTGLKSGTYIVEEVDPADGYSIINASETIYLADSGEQSVVNVRFDNAPDGILLIRKVCSVNPSVTLANAEFKITYADGTLIGDSNGIFRTDEHGEIRVPGLKPGKSVIVTETKAPDGYIIDTQSQTVQIKEGRTVSLTFKNQPKGKLIIQKRDSATGQPLPGAEFRVTTAAGCEVGLDGVIGTGTLTQNGIFTTDGQGEITITNLAPGAYVLTEIKAPTGYVMDRASTNVVIGKNGDTQTVIVKNSKAGTLVIDKRDFLTGKPLQGVTFKVTTSTGEFVPAENGQISSNGLYFTDKDGKITIHGVVGTLVVTETATIPGYTIDEASRTQTVVVNPNDTQTLHFTNTPSTTLVIEKYIEGTTTPLKGVTFLVTDSSGAVVGRSNGEFITDENGRVVIHDLIPGTTVMAREVKTVDGFVLDGTPKSILIKAGEVQTLTFYNKKQGTLVIRKLDSVSLKPLSGVEFQITYADRGFVDAANGHLSSKGLYTTDANGEIRISGVTGTLVVKETKPLDGYVVDPATQSQTVEVNPLDTQTLTFYNTPEGGLQIIKSDADTGKRLSGVVFEIRKMDGEIIGTYTTDANGVIRIPNAKSGWYTIMERKAANGYRLDAMTPTQACVKDGETTTVEITNQRMCSIMIHKVDANTGKGLYGVKFVIYDSGKNPIMEVETDQDGYAYVRDELAPGKYFIRELEAASGYIRDEQYKTVYVEAGKCTQIEWENSAVTGQIQVRKYATDDNSVTGQHAGTALEGAVFEISQARSGSVVGYIVTDARGVAASGPLPLGRYYVTEVSAPKYYQLSGEKMEAEIEYPNQIIKLSSYNKPAKLGVTIKKTGNYEVQPGQSMSYHFSGIANTSNVALNSFFWHDRIPTDATRAMSISTGTYNQRLYYKVTFKTNLNDYRTLASNLLTANNYSLSLNAAALGLVQGEYVTDVRFEFGTVPSGFSSVVKPTMRVQVLGTVSNGYQIINRADVGGKYLNEWQTAKSPWITTVRRFNTTPLPKTGY
ncbi:SpaA isopeptide-forming pilin-related protein [Oscillibacter valericigenes]|nr:SpaA isopeptide-forming pilin-related protein [Oscillibacter valericigenes]